MDRVGFSVAETARRVGVAGSTLRTWERRYGVQPSLRTAGGHRRYTVQDVAALQQLRRLVAAGLPTGSAAARLAAADGAPAGGHEHRPALVDRFAAAVQAIDREASTRLAVRIVSQLGVVDAWTDVFVPHLQAAGEHWGESGHGTEREHLGTAAIQFALLRHHLNRVRPAPPARVLAVATADEAHTLPLDALAAGATDVGIGTCVLGTLPSEGVHDAVAELQPVVVVVWARSRATADLRLLRSLGRVVPVVCAAGPGWPRRLPAGVAHVNDLPGALAALRTWIG